MENKKYILKNGEYTFIGFYIFKGEKYPYATDSRPDLKPKIFSKKATAEKYLEMMKYVGNYNNYNYFIEEI